MRVDPVRESPLRSHIQQYARRMVHEIVVVCRSTGCARRCFSAPIYNCFPLPEPVQVAFTGSDPRNCVIPSRETWVRFKT